MLVPAVAMILGGIYGVIFSETVSERAQREKWAFGGNRVFVVVAGIVLLAMGGLLLLGEFEFLGESDRSRPAGGWRWFWAVLGLFIFSGGPFYAARSRQMAEKSVQLRKLAVFPICTPASRRGWVIMGAIQMLWGASWVIGSLL